MIPLRAFVRDGRRKIGDGVIESLHLDQKGVLVEGDTPCVSSELGQNLGIGSVGKLTPVHLDREFLEIVPALEHGAPGSQASHHDAILADITGNHARR